MSDLRRILLVDDDARVLHSLQRILRSPGLLIADAPRLAVEAFTQPELALDRAAEVSFDLAVVDYRMPGMNGVQLLRHLRSMQPQCSRVILTGTADLQGMASAINEARIQRYIAKPWDDWQLLAVLGDLMAERPNVRQSNDLARQARHNQRHACAVERERQRLEHIEPGITHVDWTSDGAVLLGAAEEVLAPTGRGSRHET